MLNKVKLFANIAGYDGIKEELMNIYNWYQDPNLKNNHDVKLPTGIIFYGPPGNGKTLFLREYVKALNAPTFVIEGDKKNAAEDIHKVFQKARKEKFAIVVIDELDLLINKNGMVERMLQSELDGVNKEGRILVLATTNSLRALSEALKRQGRFDRHIRLEDPDQETVRELYKYYLAKLKINTANIDLVHLCHLSHYLSCADIKAIVNDAYLRYKENVDTKALEASYEYLRSNDFIRYNPLKYRNWRVAIHEAGHAIMALRFNQDLRLYNSKFTNSGGITNTYDIDDKDTIKKRLERVQIALSGPLAEKIFFKHHDIGSASDFENAQMICERLITRTCYHNTDDFVQTYLEESERPDTEKHHTKCEKKMNRIMKKQMHLALKYLKKHKNEIKAFADLLYEKGEVNRYDSESTFAQIVETKPINPTLIPREATSFANRK